MFCSKCGNKMPDDAAFCQECGAPAGVNPGESKPVERKVISVKPISANPSSGRTVSARTMPAGTAKPKPAEDESSASKTRSENPPAQTSQMPQIDYGQSPASNSNAAYDDFFAVPGQSSGPGYTPPSSPSGAQYGSNAPEQSGSNKSYTTLIASLAAAAVAVIVLTVLGYCYFTDSWFFKDDASVVDEIPENIPEQQEEDEKDEEDTEKPVEEEQKEPEEEKEPEPKPQIDIAELNSYIDQNSGYSNVAVAVIDNKTGQKYESSYAGNAFSAWGFYLPVYMAFPESSDIMSNNPGICNSAANSAIDAMGGTAAITSHLQSVYSLSVTSYGRKFGDTKAANDNYTCASEAAKLLYELNGYGQHGLLCYNYGNFGIAAPYGASMYSQVGTENINQKSNLNLFAIIKGINSDYSIAILTRGGSSHMINSILGMVHNQMEAN